MSAISFKPGPRFLIVAQFEKEKQLPSLPRMAANLVRSQLRSVASQARGNARLVTDETRDARRAICRSNVCGFYRESDGRCGHRLCGCPTQGRGIIESKTELFSEFCPERKWLPGEMAGQI